MANTSQAQIEQALQALDPQFKALRAAIGALKGAQRLAGADSADALPMQKALTKLEAAAAAVDDPALAAARAAFAADTQQALDNLTYDFASALRDAFAARGEAVAGRPPTLAVGLLTLSIDIAARKGQWFYGKEPLTGAIPLSLTGVLKAYDAQARRIAGRTIDAATFLDELYQAWKQCVGKRKQRPQGGRISIVELHSQVTLNRQSARFWNAPARRTFKDYERELFVRDIVLLREQEVLTVTDNGESLRLRLGVATKNQADQASRSMWIPDAALDGQYYADLFFD